MAAPEIPCEIRDTTRAIALPRHSDSSALAEHPMLKIELHTHSSCYVCIMWGGNALTTLTCMFVVPHVAALHALLAEQQQRITTRLFYDSDQIHASRRKSFGNPPFPKGPLREPPPSQGVVWSFPVGFQSLRTQCDAILLWSRGSLTPNTLTLYIYMYIHILVVHTYMINLYDHTCMYACIYPYNHNTWSNPNPRG
jgi:hypothetical protein